MFRQKHRIWFYREKGIVGNMSSDHFIEQQLPKRKWNGKYLNVKREKKNVNDGILNNDDSQYCIYFWKAIVPFYFTLTENKMTFLTIHVFGSGCPFYMKMRTFVWFRKKVTLCLFQNDIGRFTFYIWRRLQEGKRCGPVASCLGQVTVSIFAYTYWLFNFHLLEEGTFLLDLRCVWIYRFTTVVCT